MKATINRELKLLLEKSERSALNKNIYIKLKLIPTKSKLLLMKSSQNVNSWNPEVIYLSSSISITEV